MRRQPLFLAASVGEADWVERLLRAGGDPNRADAHGWPPIVAAAASGGEAAVRLLLAAGADPAHRLPDGRMALDLASNDEMRTVLPEARAK